MKIDFHSHILPEMDDGAKSDKESLIMLDMLKKDSVDIVLATPHLYLHRDTLNSFLKRRDYCYNKLLTTVEDKGYPKIILGAEIYFTPTLEYLPMSELCIEGTDYLLLELPYASFSREMFKSLRKFITNSCKGLNIILAHIERYYEFNPAHMVEEALSLGLMCQGNCESIFSKRSRKHLIELINAGNIQLLGTDLHDTSYRPPFFKAAEDVIRNEISDKIFEAMMTASKKVLSNEKPDEIMKYFKKTLN